MAEAIGRFKPGANLPVFANEQIPAGRCVMLAATKTASGAYSGKLGTANITAFQCVGISQRESGPTTDPATSWTREIELQASGVALITAAEAITAGEEVYVGGEGKIKKWESGKNAIGLCMATCTSGALCEVQINVG